MVKTGRIAKIIGFLLLFFMIIELFYVKIFPKIVNIDKNFIKIEHLLNEKTGYEIKIVNPEIKTYLDFSLSFSSKEIILKNSENKSVFYTKDSFIKIQPLKILIKKLEIDEIRGTSVYFNLTPFIEKFQKLGSLKNKAIPLKIDAQKALIQINGYEVVLFDKSINNSIYLKGSIFDIQPMNSKLSKLTTEGSLSIDKDISTFNLNIISRFLFGNKKNLQDFYAVGYIKNLDLEALSPYLNKFTDYKNAKGIINLQFNTTNSSKKDKIAEIIGTVKELSVNKGDLKKQIIAEGLTTIKLKINANDKHLRINEFNLDSSAINLYGNGNVNNYLKQNPNLNLNIFVRNQANVQKVVDMLPHGLCNEINIVKDKGVSGNVEGKLNIKGKFPDLKFYGNIKANNVHALRGYEKIHNGNIDLTFNDTTVYTVVNVKMNNGEIFDLKGYGKIYDDDWSIFDIKTTDSLNLKLVTEILKPVSKIFDFDIGPVPLFSITKGTGSAVLHIKGTKGTAYIDGNIKIKNAAGKFDGITANLSNINLQINFNGENIFFDTNTAYANNNPLHIFGTGSTNGDLNLHIASERFNSSELQKIINRSNLLADVSNVIEMIEQITGNLNFDILLQGNFDTNIPMEKLQEHIKNLKVNGQLFLLNNSVRIKGFNSIINSVNGKVIFNESLAEAKNINIKFGQDSKATVDFQGKISSDGKDFDSNIKIEGNSLLLKDSLNFISKSDFGKTLKLEQIKIPNFNSRHSLSFSAKINKNNIDMKSIYAKINIFENLKNNSKILLPSGEIIIQNNNVFLKSLKIQAEKSTLFLSGQIKNYTSLKPLYEIKVKGANIDVKSITDLSDIFPVEIKNTITQFKDFDGFFNTNLELSDRGFSGVLNLKNLKFRHIKSNIPFYFENVPISLTKNKLTFGKITGQIGRTVSIPMFTDISIENYTKIPIIKGSIAIKPTSAFVERYINSKLTHPIKLTGDVNFNADINGSVDSLKISPVLKLNKDADISYLTVNLGNTELLRELNAEVYVKPQNIIVQKAEYIQNHISAEGKNLQVPIWFLSAVCDKKGTDLIPKYIAFKTYRECSAKILNFIFKKSIIKNGSFNCDIIFNENNKNPKIKGLLNIKGIEIPSYNIKIFDGKINANDNIAKISSNGDFLDTNFVIDTNIKNSLKLPLAVENITLQTKKFNLERLLNTINKWSIESYSDNSINTEVVKFDASDVIIEKGVLKADKIDYKTCPIEDFNAKFSLDKNSDLKIDAENFKIAEGIAENKITLNLKTGKINCLFKAKSINSDLVADSFLGLKNQITGNADVKLSVETKGVDDIERLKNINGVIYFSVKDGNMPKLGSIEYLIRASNLLYSGLTTLSVNNIIELLKPFKQGSFSTITGVFSLNKGVVENLRVYSQGINMSLFMNGRYNIEDSNANIVIFGKLGKKIDNLFGPIGNLSANTLFNLIPRDKDANIYEKELRKIPDIEFKNQEVKYFRATVEGDINTNDSASTFRWIK